MDATVANYGLRPTTIDHNLKLAIRNVKYRLFKYEWLQYLGDSLKLETDSIDLSFLLLVKILHRFQFVRDHRQSFFDYRTLCVQLEQLRSRLLTRFATKHNSYSKGQGV